jgi:hypothetical protein
MTANRRNARMPVCASIGLTAVKGMHRPFMGFGEVENLEAELALKPYFQPPRLRN